MIGIADCKDAIRREREVGKVIALENVRLAWADYNTSLVLQVMREGKKEVLPLASAKSSLPGTSAKVCRVKEVMEFPDYLEEMWQKK